MSTDSQPPTLDEVAARVATLEARDLARDRSGRRLVHRAMAVVLLVVAIAAFGTWRAEQASNRSEAASKRVGDESIERQAAACGSTNEFRRLFRGYLDDQAAGVDAASAVSLAGFDALDPATKAYVRSLVALVNDGALDAAQARDEYVRRFPLVDCEALRRDLVAGRTPPP